MSINKEIQTYFGRCRCCLSYGYLRDMWTEHYSEGETEVYGKMLAQCFALPLLQLGSKQDDQICEECVLRLRDANTFKNMVLGSQDELMKEMGSGPSRKSVSIDNVETKIKIEKDQKPIIIVAQDQSSPDIGEANKTSDKNWFDTDEAIEYEDVVFLEEEDIEDPENFKKITIEFSPATTNQENTASPPSQKRKRRVPKRFKQYTAETLRKAVATVIEEEMTAYEASEVFKIPRKTIVAKVKEHKESDYDPDKEETYKLIQEIKTILTYTNATPFKSKVSRFYCMYCPYEGVLYDDSNELRTHTRTQHADDRVSGIEFAMRPQWMNEVLKLDIDNLICNVCCSPISNWEGMFNHLKQQHDVTLDLAYKRVIPYELQGLKCALCDENFTLYKHLDSHMDLHYDNHVCSDCGDTFISNCRLKKHSNMHKTGFPCPYCSKVLTLEKSRKRHVDMYHKEMTAFECLHCKDSFPSEYLRHLHVVDNHNEKTNVYTCEICGETFTWWLHFLAHKKKHNIRK